MKKIVTNVCLSVLIALPLLPSLIPVKTDINLPRIQPMSYFEDIKELY